MAEIHKSVTIDAPPEKVFDLLDDPEIHVRALARRI
jgi:uncharacterized protein YndB with AHSA1/START domain